MAMDAFRITAAEYSLILDALQQKYGFGYSKEPDIGRLQAKLSIMAEAATSVEKQQMPIKKA